MTVSAIIIVPKTTGLSTSALAWNTTNNAGLGLWLWRFSRRRRKVFSTPTIPLSTISPMATASPPNVIVLIERPKAPNTNAVMIIDSGIAVSVMNVVRKLTRNKNRTITTRMLPSRSAPTTFSIAMSIKSFCW